MIPAAAMVFAAGFGRRMGALTADRPKPLIEVAGRALVDRQIDLLDAAGIHRRVVNLHHMADRLAAHLGDRALTLREHPDILETGGGLKHALPLLAADPVLTMTSDAVWSGPNPVGLLAGRWRCGDEALLLCIPAARAEGHRGSGDFDRDATGRLTRGSELIFTGVQILRTGRVAAWPERVFSLNPVWDAMIADGTLRGVVYPGRWADVGHPGGIAVAEAMLADG